MIFYKAKAPKAALSAMAGQEVRLAHDDRGFRVVLPDGSDPKGESEAWASYSSAPQPDALTVAAWTPPEPKPEDSPFHFPADRSEKKAIEAKLESAKSGTQAEKTAALRESVEAIHAALVARGIL